MVYFYPMSQATHSCCRNNARSNYQLLSFFCFIQTEGSDVKTLEKTKKTTQLKAGRQNGQNGKIT